MIHQPVKIGVSLVIGLRLRIEGVFKAVGILINPDATARPRWNRGED